MNHIILMDQFSDIYPRLGYSIYIDYNSVQIHYHSIGPESAKNKGG